MASEFHYDYGVIHFTHGFNLKTALTVQEQYQMLEAQFFHHARRWLVEDVRLNHEDLICFELCLVA
jgi:hypothetical protein